jgi:hypothetical protein
LAESSKPKEENEEASSNPVNKKGMHISLGIYIDRIRWALARYLMQ